MPDGQSQTASVAEAQDHTLVATKIVAPLDPAEFERRLEALKQLHITTGGALQAAGASLVAFAVAYVGLYVDVAGDSVRVSQLHTALDLSDFAATRLRTIAGQSTRLAPILKDLPPALEPLYEITLALKRGEPRVREAVKNRTLTPASTLREIRSIRKRVPVSVRSPTPIRRKKIKAAKPPTAARPISADRLIKYLQQHTRPRSMAAAEVTVDTQHYGTTIRGSFTITNIRRNAEGSVPSSIPPHIAEQIKKLI